MLPCYYRNCLVIIWICSSVINAKQNCHSSSTATLHESLASHNENNTSFFLCYGREGIARSFYNAAVTYQRIDEKDSFDFGNTSKAVVLTLKKFMDVQSEETLGVIRSSNHHQNNANTPSPEITTIMTHLNGEGIRTIDLTVDVTDHFTMLSVFDTLSSEPTAKTVLVLLDFQEWNIFVEYGYNILRKDLLFINLVTINSRTFENRLPDCFYELPVSQLLPINDTSKTSSLLLWEMNESKMQCFITQNPFVRVTGSLGDNLFITEHQNSSFVGNILCSQRSYPCRVPPDNNGTSWEARCCGGFLVELGLMVFDKLGYTWSLYITPDGFFGSFENCTKENDLTSCTWSGMINELIQDNADLALGMLTETSQRVQVVDFTENIATTTIGIAIRTKQEKLSFINWKFIQSLDWTLLSALPFKLIIVCCCLFLAERIINRKQFLPGKYNKREAFSYGAGLTFQRDLAGKTPDFWAARIVAISYAIALTIIMSTYMANLTATNISLDSSAGFKGMKDERIVNPTPDFRYGIGKHTSTEIFFKTNTIHSQAHSNPHFQVLADGTTSAMEKIFKGELDGFISETLSLSSFLNKAWWYCENIIIHEDKMVVPNSLATKKGSRLNAIVSQAIREVKVHNGFQRLVDKWFHVCPPISANFFSFTAEYAGGLVVVVALFVVISVIVLSAETLYVHRRTKYDAQVAQDKKKDSNNNNKDTHLNRINFHKMHIFSSGTKPISTRNISDKNFSSLQQDKSVPELTAYENFGYDYSQETNNGSGLLF